MTILHKPFAVGDVISVVRETRTRALHARLAARDAASSRPRLSHATWLATPTRHVIRMAVRSPDERVSTHGRLTPDGLVYTDQSCGTRGNIIKRACR
jgi:hypothetical protein